MKPFPLRSPETVFEWAALRENFRNKIEVLGMRTLSVLYGLSNVLGFQDDKFVLAVEDHLSRSADPARTRFDFAYELASGFWDTYELWDFGIVQFTEGKKASDFVEDFHDKVLKWLLDGLTMYPNDTNVMDSAYFVVSRIGNYDTFLEEEDIALMESAAKTEISIRTSEGGKRLMELFANVIGIHKPDKDKDRGGQI